jgi:hypothetical protein
VPLLEYYAGREWMFTVDGSQPPDAVHADILARLAKLADFVPPSDRLPLPAGTGGSAPEPESDCPDTCPGRIEAGIPGGLA